MAALQFSSTLNSKADGRNLGCFTSILKFFDLGGIQQLKNVIELIYLPAWETLY